MLFPHLTTVGAGQGGERTWLLQFESTCSSTCWTFLQDSFSSADSCLATTKGPNAGHKGILLALLIVASFRKGSQLVCSQFNLHAQIKQGALQAVLESAASLMESEDTTQQTTDGSWKQTSRPSADMVPSENASNA